jgi:hypothetical protein
MGSRTSPTHFSISSSEQTTRKKCRFTGDELGALENEFGLLTSSECKDWSKVDRALWAFFDMLCRMDDFPVEFDEKNRKYVSEKEPFIAEVMSKTCLEQNIVVHKFFVLLGLLMFSNIREYYTTPSTQKKMESFVKVLEVEMIVFLDGGLKKEGIMDSRLDAKYPSMMCFVAEMITTYVSI